MKRLLVLIMSISMLFSSAFATSIDFEKMFESIRPSEEIEIIELYLETVQESFDTNSGLELECIYFDNVDIISVIFTLKHISSNDLNARDREQLKTELEGAMSYLRDKWIENMKTLGIYGVKVVVLCNTNDFERIAEVWDERIKPNKQ